MSTGGRQRGRGEQVVYGVFLNKRATVVLDTREKGMRFGQVVRHAMAVGDREVYVREGDETHVGEEAIGHMAQGNGGVLHL